MQISLYPFIQKWYITRSIFAWDEFNSTQQTSLSLKNSANIFVNNRECQYKSHNFKSHNFSGILQFNMRTRARAACKHASFPFHSLSHSFAAPSCLPSVWRPAVSSHTARLSAAFACRRFLPRTLIARATIL